MLSYAEDTENKIVELTIDGLIKKDEFDEVSKKLEQRMNDWGPLRVLKRVDSFKGIEPSALLKDLQFAFKHFRDVKKVAIVTDKEWVEKLAEMTKFLSPCEVRCFENEDIDKARVWLH